MVINQYTFSQNSKNRIQNLMVLAFVDFLRHIFIPLIFSVHMWATFHSMALYNNKDKSYS